MYVCMYVFVPLVQACIKFSSLTPTWLYRRVWQISLYKLFLLKRTLVSLTSFQTMEKECGASCKAARTSSDLRIFFFSKSNDSLSVYTCANQSRKS